MSKSIKMYRKYVENLALYDGDEFEAIEATVDKMSDYALLIDGMLAVFGSPFEGELCNLIAEVSEHIEY